MVAASAASSAVMVIRQVCTSRDGGRTSTTSPSLITSGQPNAFIPSLAYARNVPPGRSS